MADDSVVLTVCIVMRLQRRAMEHIPIVSSLLPILEIQKRPAQKLNACSLISATPDFIQQMIAAAGE
jgi:hypothetical protein